MQLPTSSHPTGGENGFFGSIVGGFGEGVGRIASEVLPIWAAQTLSRQEGDLLSQYTFWPPAAQARNDDGMEGTTGAMTTGAFSMQPAQMRIDMGAWTTIGVVAVAAVAGVLLVRAAVR